jgi:hypothetical protein
MKAGDNPRAIPSRTRLPQIALSQGKLLVRVSYELDLELPRLIIRVSIDPPLRRRGLLGRSPYPNLL